MQKEKKDKHFIKKPEYIGGEAARRKYVTESLRYPEEALKNNIQGAVHLQYAVGYQGNIKNVKVISGIGFGCDEEAIRIVKGFQYKVSRKHHLQVEFNKNIHIHFKIDMIRWQDFVDWGRNRTENDGVVIDFTIPYLWNLPVVGDITKAVIKELVKLKII